MSIRKEGYKQDLKNEDFEAIEKFEAIRIWLEILLPIRFAKGYLIIFLTEIWFLKL